jgi:hypothetical protein
LHDLQHKQAAACLILFVFDVRPELVLFQFFGPVLMRALLLSQVVKQLPEARVLRSSGRLFVEAACLHLHRACLVPDRFQPEWPYQPDRLPAHKASHVVPAKERYVVAKLLAKELDEAPPVARFLGPHAVEDLRRSRKVLTEALGEIGIDPLVFFFKRYG